MKAIDRFIGKGFASLALACVCGYWMYLNKGTSGIGWFIIGLVIIWGF
jgi:hypothetical protein